MEQSDPSTSCTGRLGLLYCSLDRRHLGTEKNESMHTSTYVRCMIEPRLDCYMVFIAAQNFLLYEKLRMCIK